MSLMIMRCFEFDEGDLSSLPGFVEEVRRVEETSLCVRTIINHIIVIFQEIRWR